MNGDAEAKTKTVNDRMILSQPLPADRHRLRNQVDMLYAGSSCPKSSSCESMY
jgi:hypothetical protein